MDSHFKFWITNKGTFRRGLQCPLFCTLDLGLPRWVPYIVNLQTRIKQQGRKCKYILLGSDTLLVNKNYKQINTDRSWLLFSLLGNRVKITLKYCTFCLLYFLINCICFLMSSKNQYQYGNQSISGSRHFSLALYAQRVFTRNLPGL